jgi:transposase
MVRATIDNRTKAVLFYVERMKQASDICTTYDISRRTLTRWVKAYRTRGTKGLAPKKPGPAHSNQSIPVRLERRIIQLKQKHIPWGARRIKFQYDLPCHWRTVHRVIKHRGMLVRIKAKPQPSKRFQRKHVDSMWQGDSFQFRISSVGKVYVTLNAER